jgi:SAM-dependent methyltransferase
VTAALTVPPVVLRASTGEALELDFGRWHAIEEEAELLDAVDGPVIDLGCGPGRLVVRLASRRVPALGVDSSPSAISLGRMRGATVLQRDIFGPLRDRVRMAVEGATAHPTGAPQTTPPRPAAPS